ncbi:MAG: translocation/assembly module TamB domain-containing protein [Gammaproteobacteria bacterium]|nr:translocation/assembly module TamB domain-containing protein [Gammaproteobacteria bacterium]
MRRSIRHSIFALLLLPVLLLAWLTTTQTGLRWVYQQSTSYLPDSLRIDKLEGRLLGPITLNGIAYRQDGNLITVDQIQLDWQPAALLTTTVDISRLHIQSLNIVAAATAPDPVPGQPALQPPTIHLPWRLILNNAQVNGFSFRQNNQQLRLNQIRLDASTLFSQIDIKNFDISADHFHLNITGDLRTTRKYAHDLRLRWQTQWPATGTINGTGQLTGNLKTTRITQQLSGPLQLTLDAKLQNLLKQLNWQARINVTKFDTALLDAQWPAVSGALTLDAKGDLNTALLSGRLDGRHHETGPLEADFSLQRLASNTLQLDQLKLYAPDSDTHLDASGQWTPGPDGGDMQLDLSWQKLRWPMQTSPWFDSAIGKGSIKGNLNHYQLTLETDSPWPQAAPSTWYGRAEGTQNGLTVQSLRVRALEGEATATGQLDWTPQLSWQASIKATGINPASRWPQWPGRLNAELTSHGQMKNGQLDIQTDVSQLTGHLREQPVSLQSQFNWQTGMLDFDHFELHAGDSQVSAQGQLGDVLALNWSINSSNLAELYPQAAGELQAQGRISGPRTTPVVKTTVTGRNLKLQDYAIGSIDGSAAVDLFNWQQVNIRLTAQNLRTNNYALQSLDIAADTTQINVQATAEQMAAQIEITGQTQGNGWQGRVERADIQSRQLTSWQLKAPASINISNKNLVADTLCWTNPQQASLCASADRSDDRWQSQLELSKVPLVLLSPWLPAELKPDGVLNATAELTFQSPEQLEGQAHIQLPPGSLSYPLLEGETNQWQYQQGTLTARLDKDGLNLSSDFSMANGDQFHINAALPGAQLHTLNQPQQALTAEAQLNVTDLALIEALLLEVQDLKGEAALKLAVTGSLGQPRLSGDIHLRNGALRIPRLGLSIDKLNLRGKNEGLDKLNVQLNAHSGDGTLTINSQTRLDKAAGWPTEISIRGDAFEASRIPEARLQVSPDLQVKLQHRTINITGKVHIPYAKLQPKDVSTAARVSGDAVVVGREQTPESKWSIITRARLTLGEQVNFYGFGFEGRFGGSLLLQDEPGQLTRATGEINIPEGRYRAYGQRLDVEHGRLLYTGGPLTNPGLDLRAVRHINNVTAGIKVRGSLDQPQLELFTIPAMGQTDALSYLLLGRPVENASGEEGSMMARAALALGLSGGDRLARLLGDRFGLDEMRVESSDQGDQASLVIGRYLSPRLYVSYGVGLVEAFNTFTVRYQLADQWQIKAESGEHQGADILYTIER